MNGHAPAAGSETNGSASSDQNELAATTPAVSSSGSPPGALLSSVFHPACSMPAPRTASVTPSEMPVGWIGTGSGGVRLALRPRRRVAVLRRVGTAVAVRAAPRLRPGSVGLLQPRLG